MPAACRTGRRRGTVSTADMARILLVTMGLCCFCWASATANDCDVLTARVLAGIRGASFERKSSSGLHIDFKHPGAWTLTVHCRVDDDLPEAVSVTWKDKFPPTTFFDLVGRAGSIVTGGRAEQIRQTAIRCHQQVLAAS
jgi:hypothetical protein